jgi:hypothetical protein
VLALVTDFASKSRKEEWIIKQEKYNQEVGDLNKIITDIILNL